MVVGELWCHLLSLELSASSICHFTCFYRPRRHHNTTGVLGCSCSLGFYVASARTLIAHLGSPGNWKCLTGESSPGGVPVFILFRVLPLEGFSLHVSGSFLMKRKASVCPPDQAAHTSCAVFEAAEQPFAPRFQPQHLPHPSAREAFRMYGCVFYCSYGSSPAAWGIWPVLVFRNVPTVPVLKGLLSSSPVLPAEVLWHKAQRPVLALMVITHLAHLALARIPCFL